MDRRARADRAAMRKLLVLACMAALVAITPAHAIAKSTPRDRDHDKMPDRWEQAHGLSTKRNDAKKDLDKDGVVNLREFKLGTDPRKADTDGDGLTDGQELQLHTDATEADTDGDGLDDGDEVRAHTNPLAEDTDGDGVDDATEADDGTDPLVADAGDDSGDVTDLGLDDPTDFGGGDPSAEDDGSDF